MIRSILLNKYYAYILEAEQNLCIWCMEINIYFQLNHGKELFWLTKFAMALKVTYTQKNIMIFLYHWSNGM